MGCSAVQYRTAIDNGSAAVRNVFRNYFARNAALLPTVPFDSVTLIMGDGDAICSSTTAFAILVLKQQILYLFNGD